MERRQLEIHVVGHADAHRVAVLHAHGSLSQREEARRRRSGVARMRTRCDGQSMITAAIETAASKRRKGKTG